MLTIFTTGPYTTYSSWSKPEYLLRLLRLLRLLERNCLYHSNQPHHPPMCYIQEDIIRYWKNTPHKTIIEYVLMKQWWYFCNFSDDWNYTATRLMFTTVKLWNISSLKNAASEKCRLSPKHKFSRKNGKNTLLWRCEKSVRWFILGKL